MSEGKRPGGLTALAVINFIFAGFGLLNLLSMVTMIALFSGVAKNNAVADKVAQDLKKSLEAAGIGPNFLIFMMALGVVLSIILLISAIGYLKQKKVLGRMMGNLYAVLSILIRILSSTMLPATAGGGFNLMFIINIIYPLLTLFLINTTFKDDLTN